MSKMTREKAFEKIYYLLIKNNMNGSHISSFLYDCYKLDCMEQFYIHPKFTFKNHDELSMIINQYIQDNNKKRYLKKMKKVS